MLVKRTKAHTRRPEKGNNMRRTIYIKESAVSKFPLPVILIAWFVLPIGCVNHRRNLAPAKDIVNLSIQHLDGKRPWSCIRQISAKGVFSLYDSSGTAHVKKHQYTIDLNGGKISARSASGQGPWEATVTLAGKCRFTGDGQPPAAKQQAIGLALRTILHRLRGPLNLLRPNSPVSAPQPTRITGVDVLGVETLEDEELLQYYFDKTTGALQFLTARPKQPGQASTTVYTYTRFVDGLAFPKKLTIMKLGEYVQIGNQPLVKVEFSEIKTH